MPYVKVMGFQSFGDIWKVFIRIMDEQLSTLMKIKNENENLGWMEYSNYGWNYFHVDEKMF
jgi:hypothetical protein